MELKKKEKIVEIFRYYRIILPAFAVIYLSIWVIQFINVPLFRILDKIFGFFPHAFNNFVYITVDLTGMDVPMGYPYVALIVVIMFLVFKKIELYIDKNYYEILKPEKKEKSKDEIEKENLKKAIETKRKEKEKKEKKELVKVELTKEELEKIENEKIQNLKSFYGLLTFELQNLVNPNVKLDIEDENKIKYEYLKIMAEKLKEKYADVSYAISDKLFIICNNMSLFNLFVRDVVKLNRVVSSISLKKDIKTALKVSFYTEPETNPKKACNMLLRINNLNILNKVVVSKYIQLKFGGNLIKCFDFCSMGMTFLDKFNPKDRIEEVELFYLKTLDD